MHFECLFRGTIIRTADWGGNIGLLKIRVLVSILKFFSSIDHLPNDALNVCFFYDRIFLVEQYNIGTNQNISLLKSNYTQSNLELVVELSDNLTVNEILQYSPSIDETIMGCELRNVTTGEEMSYLFGNECLNYIDVSKYVSNYYVCYRFILKISMDGFDDAMIAFDPIDPSVVSLISFNTSLFNHVGQFIAFYNSKDSLPTEELIQATNLDRILQSDHQVTYNSFGVRYKVDRIKRLEPPYATMCRYSSKRNDYLACVNESVVSTFNRLSSMSQHTNGSLKLMSGPLLRNISNALKYFDIVRDCRNMFHWNDCNISVFTSSNDEKILSDTFQVLALLPDQFDILINNHPRLVFLDYMTLCFSCFGTWLGFSFLGVNPFKWRKLNPVSPVENESVVTSGIRPMYQTQTIRLLLETVKQQQEWMVQKDQESQTMRNELRKLARKLPR